MVFLRAVVLVPNGSRRAIVYICDLHVSEHAFSFFFICDCESHCVLLTNRWKPALQSKSPKLHQHILYICFTEGDKISRHKPGRLGAAPIFNVFMYITSLLRENLKRSVTKTFVLVSECCWTSALSL